MKFSQSRRAIAAVVDETVQQDLETAIESIEDLARIDHESAGRGASDLIATVLSLCDALPARARFDLVDAILTDAVRSDLPHTPLPRHSHRPAYGLTQTRTLCFRAGQ